jgi:carbamoyl-phosphate synthase/aspartate carbamoyltransferase
VVSNDIGLCHAFLSPTLLLSPHVHAESLAIPEEVKHEAGAHGGVVQEVSHSLTEAILARTHVLYVTRVQKERFEREADYDAVKDAFIITKETMAKVGEGSNSKRHAG